MSIAIDRLEVVLEVGGDYRLAFDQEVLNLVSILPNLAALPLKAGAMLFDHPKAAVNMVLKQGKTGKLERPHQLRQMQGIIRLVSFGGATTRSRWRRYCSPGRLSAPP